MEESIKERTFDTFRGFKNFNVRLLSSSKLKFFLESIKIIEDSSRSTLSEHDPALRGSFKSLHYSNNVCIIFM